MSELIVGSVGVQLVPSADGFREKTKSLLSGLLVDVGLRLDDALVRTELDDLTRDRSTNIVAEADTAAAETRLDAAARDRHSTIDLGVVGGEGSGGGGGGLIAGLLAGVAILGPALVPIAAAFSGIAITAGVAAKEVVSTEKTAKQIAQLRARGTKESLAQAKALEESLSRPQRRFLAAQGALGAAFANLVHKVGPALFRPLTAGLNLIADILPKLVPLIRTTSNIFTGLIDRLDKGVKDGGFTKFLNYAIVQIPPVLKFLGEMGKVFGKIFVGLAPAGSVVLALLTDIFGLLAKVPADVLAPLSVALLGLFAGPEVALFAGFAVVLENLYAKSQPFKKAVDDLASSVKKSLTPAFDQLVKLWNNSLLPTLKQIGPPLALILVGLIEFGAKFLGAVLPPLLKFVGVLTRLIYPAFKTLANIWLTLVGVLVNGAAKAFGWVPGIGGKLKKAADEFNTFRDSVNAALDGIHPTKAVYVDVHFRAFGKADILGPVINQFSAPKPPKGKAGSRALGGPVLAGLSYDVNENGIETFTPKVDGTIRPYGANAASEPISQIGQRMAFTITNWQQGTGHFENIADSRVNAASAMRGETDRAL